MLDFCIFILFYFEIVKLIIELFGERLAESIYFSSKEYST